MPSRRATVTVGLIEQVDTLITHNSAALTAAGIDPAALKTRLSTAKAGILTSDSAKEEAHILAERSTETADTAEQTGYDDTTSVVDAVAGALGKKSDSGKQVLALRAGANRQRKSNKPPTPPIIPPA